MFCYQCEQTAKGTGCTNFGVCGKDPETAALQDLVIYAAKGIALYASRAAKLGDRDREIDLAVVEALFSTVTNVNFDPTRFTVQLQHLAGIKEKARRLYESACHLKGQPVEVLSGPAEWAPA